MSRSAHPSPGADQQLVVVYDRHDGGEFGRLSPDDAPNDSFTGTNVVPYLNGGIGPRAGLKSVNPTGRANGVIHALGATAAGGGRDVWYQQGTAIRAFPLSGAITTYAGALASTPTEASDMTRGVSDTVQYLINPGDKCYKLDHTAATVTALAGSPGGRAIALYGDRLMASAGGVTPYRLFYSAPADFTSWPVTNFIDVGSPLESSGIRGLYPMRDFLVIVMRNFTAWILTGVPGVNETLRRATQYEPAGSIFHPSRGGSGGDGSLWAVGNVSTAPVRFNGARWEPFPHLGSEYGSTGGPAGAWSPSLLQTATLPPEYGVFELGQRDDIGIVGNNRGLIRRHGVWSKHEFGVTVTGHVAGGTVGSVVVTDGGGAGAQPNFWRWNTSDDKPPVKNGGIVGQTSVGDGSDTAPTCSYSYPEWWSDPGYEVQLRHVVVDYTDFNTGVSATNHFSVNAVALGVYESTPQSYTAQTIDHATTGDANVGAPVSKLLSFHGRTGRGFRVDIGDIRGVRIDRVTVSALTRPVRQG